MNPELIAYKQGHHSQDTVKFPDISLTVAALLHVLSAVHIMA